MKEGRRQEKNVVQDPRWEEKTKEDNKAYGKVLRQFYTVKKWMMAEGEEYNNGRRF